MVKMQTCEIFNYQDKKTKNLVQKMLQDEMKIYNVSKERAIEDHLLNSLITDDKDISFWIQCLYTGEWTTGQVLSSVFDWNTEGMRFGSGKMDLRNLIRFAIDELDYLDNQGYEEVLLEEFIQASDSLIEFLSKLDQQETDKKIQSAIETLKGSISLAKYKPTSLNYEDLYQLVLDNWDVLKTRSIPFSMLSIISLMRTGWRSTPESRIKLTGLLRNIKIEITNIAEQ